MNSVGWIIFIILVLLLLALLIAISTSSGNNAVNRLLGRNLLGTRQNSTKYPNGVQCFSNSDCGTGNICFGTMCVPPMCTRSPDGSQDTCSQYGKYCAEGRCMSQFCGSDDQCANLSLPDGTKFNCAVDQSLCRPDTCSADEQCPYGMVCTPQPDGSKKCIPKKYDEQNCPQPDSTCGCKQDDQCPLGFACIKSMCVDWGCKADAECGTGMQCVNGSCVSLGSGACLPYNKSIDPQDPQNSMSVCQNKNGCVLPPGADTHTHHYFLLQNNSSQDLYMGIVNNAGVNVPVPGDGGFLLKKGEVKALEVSPTWAGRLWARTYCTFDAQGKINCLAGQCPGQTGDPTGVKCALPSDVATLAEFALDANNMDSYDVSAVDGLNVSMVITPIDGTFDTSFGDDGDKYKCGTKVANQGTPYCVGGIVGCCPAELSVLGPNGELVKCQNPLHIPDLYNKDPVYLCDRGVTGMPQGTSLFNSPTNCMPSKWPINYSTYIGSACPNAYSFSFGDSTVSYTCRSKSPIYTSYCISFCDL